MYCEYSNQKFYSNHIYKMSTSRKPNSKNLHIQKRRFNLKLQSFGSNVTRKDLNVGCCQNFNDFLNYSTLHGLRYVGYRTISRCER